MVASSCKRLIAKLCFSPNKQAFNLHVTFLFWFSIISPPSRVFINSLHAGYNPFLVYCRELAPGTVSLTGDRVQGDDSKYDSHYKGG